MSTESSGGTGRDEWENIDANPTDEELGYPPADETPEVGSITVNRSDGDEAVLYDRNDPDGWIQSSLWVTVHESND